MSNAPAIGKRTFDELATTARDKIAAALPPDMNVDRFIQTVKSAYQRNADLAKCSHASILKAMMQAAEVGLTPNTAFGHAYLVPFNNKKKVNEGGRIVEKWVKEAAFQIGYKGFVFLALQAKTFTSVDSRVIYAADEFSLVFTPTPVFRHAPCMGDDRGPATHYYAYGTPRHGEPIVELASKGDIEKIRLAAPSKDSPAWRNWYDEMAKGKVLKRMLKDQPIDERLAKAIEIDDEGFRAAPASTPAKAFPSRSEALAHQLDAPKETAFEDDEFGVQTDEPGSDG